MFRPGALLAVLFLSATMCVSLRASVTPETGALVLHNYTAKDYSASPQNWAVVQDSRGVIYVGNTSGVLEFDGVNWRKIDLPKNSGARSLAVDSRGTVFVGDEDLFGYLAPDSQGTMQFVSLVNHLPKADQSFGKIWDILPTSDGVYFCSHRRLILRSDGDQLKVWKPTQRFGRAFTAYEELFVTTPDRGLLQMVKGDLQPSLEGDENLVKTNVIFALGDRPLLANKRLFHFSLSAIEPFPTAADSYFDEHRIYAVSQWQGGDIAVGTTNGGIVLLDQSGAVERIITTKSGLSNDNIHALFRDRQGGIWVATDGGITRFTTSLSSFGEPQGLRGGVQVVRRLQGAIYAGTSSGLFRMRPMPSSEPTFAAVPSFAEEVYDLVESGGVSLVGARHGLYEVNGNKIKQILKTDLVKNICFSARDPQLVFIAGGEGVQMLLRDGKKWTVAGKESKGRSFDAVMEDPDGRVWATTRSDVVERIDFRSDPPKVEVFDAKNGVPPDFKNIYLLHGQAIFATNLGLLRFSDDKRKFVPDPELGPQFSDGSRHVSFVVEDKSGNVWVAGDGYNGLLIKQSAGGFRWFPAPLQQAGINQMYALYADVDGTAWASGDAGILYRRLTPAAEKPAPPLNVMLRSALITARNSVLFSGDGPAIAKPQLPYSDNALRFEVVAPFPEDQSSVQYQFRLDGSSEKEWSPWQSQSRQDYNNLWERSYTFHVRARDPHDDVSPEVAFSFEVHAPWYRTWWAAAFYVSAFLFAGWLILRWRLRLLQAKNKWLEHVVEERTAEVRSERDQNEALLLNILPKPVATELRSTGAVKPTSFDDVTVCFSDFVGFTLSSEKLPAEELISSLNEYFTAFDEIIGRYGLEKLKTIGDAYMFASGLPTQSPSHAVDAVLAALEMVAASQRLARPDKGVNWRIRLGLYSGPVVAGVVGKRKFAFDIWGNTVNFAARMESSGAADRVNLSSTTCVLVSDFIECEPRGRVRIKEGRELDMFFAVRPKQDLLGGPMIDGIPEAFRARYEKIYSVAPKSFPDLAVFDQSLVESQTV